ncbi:MAG: diaminopimelate epimerase [Clostridiales bacterium]|nr:diaminopimelate epimerase [Clostridiales bacterium]
MRFTKMHGAGNDYIYVNAFEQTLEDPPAFAARFSDRHKGIGGDGLVLIGPSEIADVRMRMFNADGSEGRMCGNASRCIAKYVYERGICQKETIRLETLAGIKELHVHAEGGRVQAVTVNMGTPKLHPADLPMLAEGETFVEQAIEVAGRTYQATAVNTGAPHLVVFTTTPVHELPLGEIGPRFERHPLFPDRVNTDFVNQLGAGDFQMRVFERGSGETLACGTGASAVVVAAVLTGRARRDQEVCVHLLGGELYVSWLSGGDVIMRGPAVEVFEGCVDV